MLSKKTRSIIVAIMMGTSAYFGSLIYQCLHLWMVFVLPKLFRWYIDITMFMWICSSISLMEWIIGTKFRLFGDKIKSNERAIFIMNHRTRLDWLYFYGILMRHGSSLRDEKIVLKNDLKRIPGPGWAMQCGSYIFLNRKLENDKCHLTNMIEYLSSVGHNTKILLFPEGTDLCKFSQDRSNKFADKMGWKHFENVLYPRTSGFLHIADEMKRCFPDFDAIYDITAAYPDNDFATNEQGFLDGRSSSEVHFHCRRYSLKDITSDSSPFSSPTDEKLYSITDDEISTKLKSFITKIWNDKEAMLSNYYQKRQFTDLEIIMDTVFFKQVISVFFIMGNVVACLCGLIFIPKISLPIFLILNGIFIYIDFFEYGVDVLAMKSSLKDKYRSFQPSTNNNCSYDTMDDKAKVN